jgi:type IV secretion/conjugal transfer VirB4 family ATPase
MIKNSHFRDYSEGVADLLPYALLIEDGLVGCKNGGLIAGYYYKGEDISSMTESDRNYTSSRVNKALSRLAGVNWSVCIDAVRFPSAEYPDACLSHFPDSISQLIEDERRELFTSEGNHFETYYVIIISFVPPSVKEKRLEVLVFDEQKKLSSQDYYLKMIEEFKKKLSVFEDDLSGTLKLSRMSGYSTELPYRSIVKRDELVNYLNFALTGKKHPVNIPPIPMYMDAFLGGQELWVGDPPKIGNHFVATVSLEGFPQETWPNMLDTLSHLPIEFRWNNHLYFMDEHQAASALHAIQRKWDQKIKGLFQQIFKTNGRINEDALLMKREAEQAENDLNSGLVAYCYMSSTVVLMSENRDELIESARYIYREIEKLGYTCRIENINTFMAYFGSLPGNTRFNLRRPMMHTLNAAHLLPLSSIWAGKTMCPSPLYPSDSPALIHTATTGSTPFRLNLHVGDLGHTLIFGPTGAGKSTLLATLIAQFLRYQNASIFAFDKGESLWAISNACGGTHYDIAGDNSPCFAPLSNLESTQDLAWAEEWIADCIKLQSGKAPTPRQRDEIHQSMCLLRETIPPKERRLFNFLSLIQDPEIRACLEYYTASGTLGRLLDTNADGLQDSHFTVLEIGELMALDNKAAMPVLLYLFRRFEKTLKGQPALLVLDEAWLMLGHPVFREKIREWLKVLRKANCAVVMATQSLSDATKSGIFDVLIESCPTKILLPNEAAEQEGTEHYMGAKDIYRSIGLNDTEIQTIKTATKKRQYYYFSPDGSRLFELGLGPIALSFVAVSDKETLAHLKSLKKEFGEEWPYKWLTEKRIHVSQEATSTTTVELLYA